MGKLAPGHESDREVVRRDKLGNFSQNWLFPGIKTLKELVFHMIIGEKASFLLTTEAAWSSCDFDQNCYPYDIRPYETG